MKRVIITVYTMVLSFTTMAQDTIPVPVQDTIWKKGGLVSLNFTQVSLSNWSAGGESSLSGMAIFNYFANYKEGKNTWDNNIDLAYGLTQTGKDDPIKSEDKIDLATKYGHHAFKKWYYSAMLGFKTQFTEGFNYPNDSVTVSDFFAPAYITLALGLDYKPVDYFSVLIAPITGRIIIVENQDLADFGAFGVDPAEYDATGVKIKDGENIRYEFGALLKAVFNKDIMENVNFQTKLELFSNYLEDPQNVDVNWEMLFAMRVNKYITASLSTQLIYDDNTLITIDENDDGVFEGVGPRTQFKEVLGVGLAYKFH